MANTISELKMMPDQPTGEPVVNDFAEKMLKRVNDDFQSAKNFMYQYHRKCLEYHKLYHSGIMYEDLKKQYKFPDSFFQEQVDVATSDALDKLFYSNRPCTVIALDEADKEDADAKQGLFDWMDYQDGIYRKCQRLF